MEPATHHEVDELLLGFTRALRSAGIGVTSDRAQMFLRATALLGAEDSRSAYWAGRSTLCAGIDDVDVYDRVFDAWFTGHDSPSTGQEPPDLLPPLSVGAEALGRDEDVNADDDEQRLALVSDTEVLRHRDIATMDPAEKARLAVLFGALSPRPPRRTANRWTAWHRGNVDARRTLRAMRATMGEPVPIRWRSRRDRPRRVVLLIDVSGSMHPYADALLRLAHTFVCGARKRAARESGVEVFTAGTRLTRVTRAMRLRDPDQAILAAGQAVPDWSGGTRLGDTLKVFLDRWGQRGIARAAVVVLVSDGWERGGTDVLAEQMQRLQRLAHRVIWMNPHSGKEAYQPVQSGIVAALPYIDDFVAGHSLATFANLVEVVARA
ncbi:VWA domain-containing protein [Nocardioides sp. YIM B13467]|uniref:vWA domain-containing protein n=1 Tax=Nocardioides sp. YIM B13467 TaxID=3366294 RepID=UPI00366B26F9